MRPKKCLVLSAESTREIPEVSARHPLNPKSQMHIRSLSQRAGLERLGLHIVRVPAGHESNEYHTHTYEEEFYYVLSGRGVATIDDDEFEVGPGWFLAFPAPSVPHVLSNPFEEDLVYLVGGERSPFEVGEFPRRGKVLIREPGRARVVDREALEELGPRRDESD